MTAPIIAFLIFYYFVIPRLVASKTAWFHKEALKLLSTGRASEIPGLVRRRIVLQLFGPRGPLDAKLGLAHAALGDYARAGPCFERAIPWASSEEKVALQIGLTKALFVNGELARAEAEGRVVLDRGTRLPELLVVVARSRVGLGKNDDMTKNLLDEAERLSPNSDVKLMIELTRIESALATGRTPRQMPPNADSSQRFLRAWIQMVRGKLREYRQDAETAAASYSGALQTGGCGFVLAEARKHLEDLGRKRR
jgi:tetratricopeptide (TPR) repeat protein